MTWDEVRALALELPGAEDGTSYGTPAVKVRGKLLVRLKEDGESVVLFMTAEEKEMRLEADPAVFHQTPHYVGWPAVLARLASADPAEIAAVLERTWRGAAGKRAVAALDAARAGGVSSG